MSVTKTPEGSYLIRFRPFGALVNLRIEAKDQWHAKRIEKDILLACRSRDFSDLSVPGKEAVIRMYGNHAWKLPQELEGCEKEQPVERLTLWKAIEIVLNYPGSFNSEKHRQSVLGSLAHVVEYFGKSKPLEDLTVVELRTYRAHRQGRGVPNSTCNREMSAVSKMFTILTESQVVESNPCRLIRRLSEKASERQVYLAYDDVARIADQCPEWFQNIIWIAYFSGMRKGEITHMTWQQVNLKKRVIYFLPDQVKEFAKKRVPIAQPLIPIFQRLNSVRSLRHDQVISIDGHPLGVDSAGNPWARACQKLELPKPSPRFHDLRGTFKTNCMRSGIDYEIREMILGHQDKARSIAQRYGFISDEFLVKEIDKLEWNFGETQIWVSSRNR